ncbi:hypothetical protein [Geotalea sp. SG265]|uniref:hypothetical protein n=1 Tax=Geotalea sp. SG265 TaxID=2922867 RepID=UPI001FB00EDB|nr:hypothetical protein [Geotalea sp. SG265]
MEKDGNLLVLVTSDTTQEFTLTRCTAKGEPSALISVSNLPQDFTRDFCPTSLWWENGCIGLVDRENGKVAVIDGSGVFLRRKSLPAPAGTAVERVKASRPRQYFRSLSLLLQHVAKGLVKVTKSSSLRNGNDSAKTPFSRNGLLLDGVGQCGEQTRLTWFSNLPPKDNEKGKEMDVLRFSLAEDHQLGMVDAFTEGINDPLFCKMIKNR